MSSQCTRKVLPIAAAAVMLVGGMSRMAAAKECKTDAECGAGNQCNLSKYASGSGGSTGTASDPGAGAATGSTCPVGANCTTTSVPPPPTQPSDAGAAPPIRSADAGMPLLVAPDALTLPPPSVTGACEAKPIVCKSVADCPSADFSCEKSYTITAAAPCAKDQKCETPPPQESETGTCWPKPRECRTAADCPAPLTCESQGSSCSGGASGGPDGVITQAPEICTTRPSACSWLPTVCTLDSDCNDPLYQCVKVSEYSMCSGAGPACTKGDGVEKCSTPEPPTCTTVVTKNCMPKPIDCGLGQTCPSGWSCFDSSTFTGFSTFAGTPEWIATATGSACLPDGIILAFQGHAVSAGVPSSVGDSSGGTGAVDVGLQTPTTSKGGRTDSNSSVTGPSPPAVTPVATTGTSTGTGTGTEAAAKVKGGGCAFGGGQAGSMDWGLALALVGLALQWARRRNANR